jgi:hypothetical protein
LCPSCLLFALAIHPIIARVQRQMAGRGVYILAYLDDLYVLGPPDAAAEATRKLRAELLAINLRFNEDKCEAWSPSGHYGALVIADADGFKLVAKPAGIKVLGLFIGESASERNLHALKNAEKAKSLANKLSHLVDFAKAGFHSYALQLLLLCAAPSPNYVLRASRPADAQATAEAADEMLVSAFGAITGIDANRHLQPESRARAQLRVPVDKGGAGLVSLVTRAKTAYFASWAAVGPLVAERFPHLAADIKQLADPEPELDYAKDVAEQRRYCEEVLHLDVNDITFAAAAPKLQQRCGDKEGVFALCDVRADVDRHEADVGAQAALPARAWLTSLACDGRAAFLRAVPSRWELPLSGDELQFAVRRLLRLPLPGLADNSGPLKCQCGCKLDPFGDHADSCPCQCGERHKRHAHVNDKAVHAPARQAKLSTSIETTGLVEDTNGRPADTFIEDNHGLGDQVAVCIDVVGCGTCNASYVESSARWVGGAWRRAVDKKLRNSRVLVHDGRQLVVVPFAFDTQGGLHPNWRIMYKLWAERWATFGEGRGEREQGMLVSRWVGCASVAIQRAQFRLVRRMRDAALPGYIVGDEPHEWRSPDLDDLDTMVASFR